MRKQRKKEAEARRKEKIFVDSYLIHWNGARAARDAGYSARSAAEIAYDLLRKPHIKAIIEERLKESAMSSQEVLARWTDQARGSMAPFIEVNADGFASLEFSSEEAKDNLHLIKKIRTKRTRRMVGRGERAEPWEDESVEVEIHDPQRALDALSKYHNLYAEKDDDGNPLTDEQRIARVVAILDAARARRAGQTPA